jgi:hypothetical protein
VGCCGGKGPEADAQPHTFASVLLVLRTSPVWSVLPLARAAPVWKSQRHKEYTTKIRNSVQALAQAVAHLGHEGGVQLPNLGRLVSALGQTRQETHLHR